MNTILIWVGKTKDKRLVSLIEDYFYRINRYQRFEIQIIPELKNKGKMSEKLQRQKEGQFIIKNFNDGDWVVLLDEKGKSLDSVSFAKYINAKRSSSQKRVVFVIGGPYGFSEEVYSRGNEKMALSDMTFSHQMVRLFFLEQLYRANTILNKESYHHQ